MRGMHNGMRMVISAATALGIALLGFSVSGISGLSGDLEAATPARPPAVERTTLQVRDRDCPLRRSRSRSL